MRVERLETGEQTNTISLRLGGTVVEDAGLQPEPGELGMDEAGRNVLICLRDVTLLNSTGIGFLLKLNHQVNDRGGRLILHSLPMSVRQVIDFMKLDQVLRIARSEQEARGMLI